MHLIVKEIVTWLRKSKPSDTINALAMMISILALALAFYALYILNTKL